MQNEPARKSCVGTGFIVLDVIRNDGRSEQRFAGGSCGNVLAILSYFGWKATAVGRIGDDDAGRELLRDLEKWDVRTKWLRVEAGRRTPVVVQENFLDAKGRPRHRFSRACPVCGAALPAYRPVLANDVEFLSSQVPPHSVFFFDRVAPGTLQMARWSRDKGALVIFEPSGIKDERLFTECLRASHVVKYSNERIEGVHGLVDAAKVPVEIETLGTSGLRLRSRDKGRAGSWVDLPAFSASSLVDAAGSGDWCTAGFLQYLFSNGSQGVDIISSADAVVAAVQFGQALATLNCGFEGARGLMYAASARRVAALADAIVSGREISLGLGGAKKVQVSPRRTKSTCGICSNALLTPA